METTAEEPISRLPEQPKKFPWQKLLYIGIFLFLVAIVVSLVYFFFLKDQASTNSNMETKTATQSATKSASAKNSEIVYVTAQEGLNLREEPSTDSLIVTLLPMGTELTVLEDAGEWYFVEAQTRGFVSKEFVTSTKPSSTILRTFKNADSPFTFLYPHVYKVGFKKTETTLDYSFSGNESYGGFTVATEQGLTTLGNYALKNYPQAQRGTCEPVRFGTQGRECEKVTSESGTIYLVLVETTLYKISYLKTEGGLFTDLNNLVFYSLHFGD